MTNQSASTSLVKTAFGKNQNLVTTITHAAQTTITAFAANAAMAKQHA